MAIEYQRNSPPGDSVECFLLIIMIVLNYGMIVLDEKAGEYYF